MIGLFALVFTKFIVDEFVEKLVLFKSILQEQHEYDFLFNFLYKIYSAKNIIITADKAVI